MLWGIVLWWEGGECGKEMLSVEHYSGLQLSLAAFSFSMLGERKSRRDARWLSEDNTCGSQGVMEYLV